MRYVPINAIGPTTHTYSASSEASAPTWYYRSVSYSQSYRYGCWDTLDAWQYRDVPWSSWCARPRHMSVRLARTHIVNTYTTSTSHQKAKRAGAMDASPSAYTHTYTTMAAKSAAIAR